MERLLIESAVRAGLIAAGTVVVLWTFRIRNDATRHKAWTGVVVLMLLLPIWTATGPKLEFEVLPPAPVAVEIPELPAESRASGAAPVRDVSAAAGTLPEDRGIPEPARSLEWQTLLLGIYLLGAGALLVRLALGTIQAHRLMRSATMQEGRLTSRSCSSPITVGSLDPAVILPEAWQQWPKAQLDAVLTHEAAHARRYDPLVQWLALLNRAVFWFHPLAWWLERRLAALAEAACDSAVLAAGHSPLDYSEYLLDLARSTMREGRRVSVVGMTMPGRDLPHRIKQIFEGVPMQPISRTRIAFTLALCSVSSVLFATVTLAQQQITPLISNVTTASAAFTEAAAQPPTRSALASPAPAAEAPGTVSPPLAVVSQGARQQSTENKRNILLLSPEMRPQPGGTLNAGIISPPNPARPATAQVQSGGRLTGTVSDASGAIVPQATVIVSTPEGTTKEIASTSRAGTFTFSRLQAGTYTLQVFAPGFGPSRISTVTVAAAQDTRHDVRMDIGFVQTPPAVGGVSAFSTSATPGSTPNRVRIGGNVARASLIQQVDPVYPAEAREARIQGVVVLEIEIGTDGRVENARVITGHPFFVPAAVEAVRQWTYRPIVLNGAPIPAVTTATVNFALQQ